MLSDDYARMEVWLPPETFRQFKAMVGPRGMSPTVRNWIEAYVAQEPVRRRIEAMREGKDG